MVLFVHYSEKRQWEKEGERERERADDWEWLQHSAAMQFNLQYLLAAKWLSSITDTLTFSNVVNAGLAGGHLAAHWVGRSLYVRPPMMATCPQFTCLPGRCLSPPEWAAPAYVCRPLCVLTTFFFLLRLWLLIPPHLSFFLSLLLLPNDRGGANSLFLSESVCKRQKEQEREMALWDGAREMISSVIHFHTDII